MVRRSARVRRALRFLVARGHPPCAICGEQIDYTLVYPDRMSFVVDHVIPLARGGKDDITNAQAAHAVCNRAKYDKEFAIQIVRRSGSLNK